MSASIHVLLLFIQIKYDDDDDDYVGNSLLIDIQSHHSNLHRFVYDAAVKNYMIVDRGPLKLGGPGSGPTESIG